ncbi:MAG: hypothetical protein CM15mP59_1300 [Flavobacteriaceae bacterium]|nr:MAG: hypothetical protein CM15mP59_1300 [Flavobacteriaceae bacterium]
MFSTLNKLFCFTERGIKSIAHEPTEPQKNTTVAYTKIMLSQEAIVFVNLHHQKIAMRKIQMVDLQSNMLLFVEQVEAGMQEVLSNAQFINGPAVKSFQSNLEAYLRRQACDSLCQWNRRFTGGNDGSWVAPGDEVITADFTFAATVEVIALLGLTPVLVDVDPVSFNISPQAIEKAITPKTKAIVPVHLFGQVADMDAIMAIAKSTTSMSLKTMRKA